MRFIKQTKDLAEILAQAVSDALQKYQRVVWLVPGGSNIAISVAAMKLIDEESSAKLVIMQTDERFVALDSPDCNWYQLQQAGLDVKRAETYPILTENFGLQDTAERYAQVVRKQFLAADYIIGQFGIGADGHIAGIKPNSPATDSLELVLGYKWDDFTRLTLTFTALKQISSAYTFAFGDDKKPTLTSLKDSANTLDAQPAQLLKLIQNSVVYNDQIEGENSK